MIRNLSTYIKESIEEIGRKVRIREDSPFKDEAGFSGIGQITLFHDNTYIEYPYAIKWRDGVSNKMYSRKDFDFIDEEEIEDKPFKIRWYNKGKLNENIEGEKVRIREDSKHYKEAYKDGGNGEGKLIRELPRTGYAEEGAYLYIIVWDNKYSDSYRRKDFDFIEDVEDEPVKIRWYKKGKLNEKVDDKSGSRVKVKDDSKHKETAYRNGGNGYGTIVNLSGKDRWDPKTFIQYYYYEIIWDNGYESRCRDTDVEIEPEPERIRWYSKGKLNERFDNIEMEYNIIIIKNIEDLHLILDYLNDDWFWGTDRPKKMAIYSKTELRGNDKNPLCIALHEFGNLGYGYLDYFKLVKSYVDDYKFITSEDFIKKFINVAEPKIRWYSKGKLNESLYDHIPSADDAGKKVRIVNNSVYREQAFEMGKSGPGDGRGTIERYLEEEDGGDEDDHIYYVTWNNGETNCYRLKDLEWDEEENITVKTRWYKKGKLHEKMINEAIYFNTNKDPLKVIGKIITFDSPEEAIKIKNKLMEYGYKVWGWGSIKYDVMNRGYNAFMPRHSNELNYDYNFELGTVDRYKKGLIGGEKLLKIKKDWQSEEPWGDEDAPAPKIKWYKGGKLHESWGDGPGKGGIGKKVKIKDTNPYKSRAYDYYNSPGDGYGKIITVSERGGFGYYYGVKWNNGYKSTYTANELEFVDEGENDLESKIRWYKGGKLSEGYENGPGSWDIGRKVKIRDNSEYKNQAYNQIGVYVGDGYGKIIEYINTPGYCYKIKWNNTQVSFYRLKDIEFVDEKEINEPVKIRWYSKGHLSEGVKWYKKGKLIPDPDSNIKIEEPIDFITNKKLRLFLIEHNCLNQFIKNCKPNFIENFDAYEDIDYINYAFTWENSPEGGRFWADLDEEWEEYLDNEY